MADRQTEIVDLLRAQLKESQRQGELLYAIGGAIRIANGCLAILVGFGVGAIIQGWDKPFFVFWK
jgi:hypothetical protein